MLVKTLVTEQSLLHLLFVCHGLDYKDDDSNNNNNIITTTTHNNNNNNNNTENSRTSMTVVFEFAV